MYRGNVSNPSTSTTCNMDAQEPAEPGRPSKGVLVARLTESQQLARVRGVIKTWVKENPSGKEITLNVLSERTGIAFTRCESIVVKYHLKVRRNARQTQEELSGEYCHAIERMREWCDERAANFRSTMIQAVTDFIRRARA